MIRLTPETFYSMTPGEFDDATLGWELQQEKLKESFGWIVGNLLMPYVKKGKQGSIVKNAIDAILGKKKRRSSEMLPSEKMSARDAVLEKVRRRQAKTKAQAKG